MNPPKHLQGVLWSKDVHRLDVKKDKTYIIHQILSCGSIKDIKWVLDRYPSEEITNTFLNHPYKDYRASRFHFVKNYLLHITQTVNEKHYVKNIPRDIR